MADGADALNPTALQLVGTGVGVDDHVIKHDGGSLGFREVPLMGPDGAGAATAILAQTGINHHYLIHYAIAVPVVVGKIHFIVNGLTGLNEHLARMEVEIQGTAVLTVVGVGLGHRDRTHHVEGEVEEVTTLVQEVIVDAAMKSVAAGEALLVGNAVIELLVVTAPEREVGELHEDDETAFLSDDW